MVWAPPQSGIQSLVKEDLSVDPARQEEKRKTAAIMEEPSDGLHEKQKRGRRYGKGQTSLAFGSGWTALGCIDPINNNNNNNNNNLMIIYIDRLKYFKTRPDLLETFDKREGLGAMFFNILFNETSLQQPKGF